jgi:RNA polymerase sigma-70 factor (ECF subfamily)
VTGPAAVEAAISDAHRQHWARVLAATVRVTRDLDLAEECVQEACAAGLQAWLRAGIPDNPAAWLTATARRRAIDALRHEQALRRRLPLLAVPDAASDAALDDVVAGEPRQQAADRAAQAGGGLPDERLRLIFTCCHPALRQDARVALTLRLVCGSRPRTSAGRSWCRKPPWRRASPARRRRSPRRGSRSGYRRPPSCRSG